MDPFFPQLSDYEIAQAKKRVWNRMQSKLVDRGVSPFSGVVTQLKGSVNASNRLQKVMMKERLLDQLPERNKVPFFMSRRLWATMTLSVFVGFFIAPVFTLTSSVGASAVNLLEVVQGEVMVNGIPVEEMALIREGDDILTGTGSMAHVQLQDDTRLTLAPRTEVILESADEEISIYQESGRVWIQVVNPVTTEGAVTLRFDRGEVVAQQRASFDVQVDSEMTEVQVSENVVAVSITQDALYEGSVGQGAELTLTDELVVRALPEDVEADVWWEFNKTYGDSYLAQLNETYEKERLASVILLPDHPLYFLKAWRESIQEGLTLSSEAKQELLAQHMEMRLSEAQILFDQGKTDEAQEALVAYQEAVDRSLEWSGAEAIETHVEEVQKELLAKLDVDEGTQFLEDQLTATSQLVAETASEKNEVRMLSASQKLSRVPGLIEDGEYEQALYYLEAYQSESLSILAELESVPMEEREVIVSDLLEQKLKDLQMLRVIASMPEFVAFAEMDMNAQILQEMSMMVLSLRERALTRLTDFFANTDYNVEMQYELYAKLKDETTLTPEITEQFEAVETALETAASEEIMADIEVVDPRFLTQDDE